MLYERHKLNWKCEKGDSVLMWFWKMAGTIGRIQICLKRDMLLLGSSRGCELLGESCSEDISQAMWETHLLLEKFGS